LLPLTVVRKLISPGILAAAACEAARHPMRTMVAAAAILRSRSFSIGFKNALTLPKGLWLARLARRRGADHIHAHWGGCSSTVAMIASTVSGIPWSMTVHSWELIENNLLRKKTASAVFTRTVSQFGQARLSRITGLAAPVRVIHLGIELPVAPRLAMRTGVRDFRLIVVANLVEIKGIEFLIEAWKLLESRGIVLRIDIFGDGPLKRKLKTLAVRAGAESYISLHGFISHDLLMSEISDGHWDAIVLPSIFADDGQEEGIPICLVEAMARGLAAI
jgi:glycosyltransferase involved in cell wall biosynthesis